MLQPVHIQPTARAASGPSGTCVGVQDLAADGRFGRDLAPEDQTFLVLSDSVMKQLDALKKLPGTAGAVRRFMAEGLDKGPCLGRLGMADMGWGLQLDGPETVSFLVAG
jgi:hypothetical protein